MQFLLILLLLAALSQAALPPEFESEIYCPKDCCLLDVSDKFRAGFSGPMRMFYECRNAQNLSWSCVGKRSWGIHRWSTPVIAKEKKAEWIAKGWSTSPCEGPKNGFFLQKQPDRNKIQKSIIQYKSL